MPKVITANLLQSGRVVYLCCDNRWVYSLRDAAVIDDDEIREALLHTAREAEALREVTSVYEVDVDVVAGRPVAKSVRERIRADLAPTGPALTPPHPGTPHPVTPHPVDAEGALS